MSASSFAHELRCQHCGKKHGTPKWPVNGDGKPFYFQSDPGKYTLPVTCPHCCKTWCVVWDVNPGPIERLRGVARSETLGEVAARTGKSLQESVQSMQKRIREDSSPEEIEEARRREPKTGKVPLRSTPLCGPFHRLLRALAKPWRKANQSPPRPTFPTIPRRPSATHPRSLETTITVSCPGCSSKHEFPKSESGKTACCSKCGLRFKVALPPPKPGADASLGPAERLGALIVRMDRLQNGLTTMASPSRAPGFNPMGSLQGLNKCLALACTTLLTGKAPDGRPAGALIVGSGLKHVCVKTLDNPAWASPLRNSLGESLWRETAAILEQVRAIASELEQSGEMDSGRAAKNLQAKALSRDDRKMEVIRKLQAIKERCGAAGLVVDEIAKAMRTGIAGDGKPTTRKDEVVALGLVAQMLEAEGKYDVAVELVFIMNTIHELGEG